MYCVPIMCVRFTPIICRKVFCCLFFHQFFFFCPSPGGIHCIETETEQNRSLRTAAGKGRRSNTLFAPNAAFIDPFSRMSFFCHRVFIGMTNASKHIQPSNAHYHRFSSRKKNSRAYYKYISGYGKTVVNVLSHTDKIVKQQRK